MLKKHFPEVLTHHTVLQPETGEWVKQPLSFSKVTRQDTSLVSAKNRIILEKFDVSNYVETPFKIKQISKLHHHLDLTRIFFA